MSVVVPVRDEAPHLERTVAAILEQDYPGPLEVCLAVAPSSDATSEIATRLAEQHPSIEVVDNPSGTTPAGLNRAIRATTGEVVVRVDGHARLSDGYVRRAVTTLQRTGAVNVGGVQDAVGTTPFERAVAFAMTSWAGTGGSRFHVGGVEGPVDTVYLGVFRRDAVEAAGGFDESLVRNQDYELNIRLRRAGGVIWFDPELRVEYRPRSSWQRLARQYYEYGWWKAEVARRHLGSLRARQIAPVVLTLALVVSLLAPERFRTHRFAVLYVGVTTLVAATAPDRSATSRLAVVLPTMHLAWGTGFIVSTLRRVARRAGTTATG